MKKKFLLKYFGIIGMILLLISAVEIAIQPNKPFYLEEKNSTDIMFFGSSLCYCTFVPSVLSEYGISSYNMGKSQQTLPWTYYLMKDSLNYQKPRTIVLEPYGITYGDNTSDELDIGISNTSFDAMRFSINQCKAVFDSVNISRWNEFLFPIVRWHSNPDSLDELGKYQTQDPNKGYVAFTEVGTAYPPSEQDLNDTNVTELSKTAKKYLNRILKLTEENNIRLMIIRSPFPCDVEVNHQMNALKIWAESNSVPFLDLAYHHAEIGLDYNLDTIDGKHLNTSGSEKVSRFVGQYLSNN